MCVHHVLSSVCVFNFSLILGQMLIETNEIHK